MDTNVVIRECRYFLLCMVMGLILLPCLLDVLAGGAFRCMEDFYVILAGIEKTTAEEWVVAWSVAAGPYLLFQLFRAAYWVSSHRNP
jgi:hypothetical protein